MEGHHSPRGLGSYKPGDRAPTGGDGGRSPPEKLRLLMMRPPFFSHL